MNYGRSAHETSPKSPAVGRAGARDFSRRVGERIFRLPPDGILESAWPEDSAITIESKPVAPLFARVYALVPGTRVYTRAPASSRALRADARARIRPPLSSLASALSRPHALS